MSKDVFYIGGPQGTGDTSFFQKINLTELPDTLIVFTGHLKNNLN
jgi:hypothetical protein